MDIELTKDTTATIDDCDDDLAALSWYLHDTSPGQLYAARGGGKKPLVFLHRAVLERKLGRALAADERADVVNNNGLDCRRENVVLSVNGLYQRNSKRRRTNTSGYTGVRYHKRDGRYHAQISIGGKIKFLGSCATAEEAAALYADAKRGIVG